MSTRVAVMEPSTRRRVGGPVAQVVLLSAMGCAAAAVVVARLDPAAAEAARSGSMLWFGGAAALTAALLVLLVARSPALAPSVIVAATSTTVSGLAMLALHGTRWSFDGLYSDAGFRTQAATRFADSASLADYGYRGLPSYYPPALPWIQGRLADVVGVPAWMMIKPVTLVLAACIPVLAFLWWRRVVPPLTAAMLVAGTSLAVADFRKPDEWLVLALILPWWLEAVRDVRAEGVRRASSVVLGAVLGGLLLVHSYYFLPFGLATVAALVVDGAAHRPRPLPLGRAVRIGAVALVCAAPYWLPMLWLRIQGDAADDLQRRWSEVGFTQPPLPLPPGVTGVLGMAGVIWLLLRLRSSQLALSLTIALTTAYALCVGGQLAQPFGVALLPEKSVLLIRALLVISGILAIEEMARALKGHLGRRTQMIGSVLVAAAVLVPLTTSHTQHWLEGDHALAAQQMRYPDGTYPAGGRPDPQTNAHPWSVAPRATGPSVDAVALGWRTASGSKLGAGTVLVSSRADLLATTPVHTFISWKSIYSHPNGQFIARRQMLRDMSRCTTARCAWEYLRVNRFDPVDGLVLTKTPSGLTLTLATDRFPEAWSKTRIRFAPELFDGPLFTRTDVGNVAVISVAHRSKEPART